jgi:hypothetical protein
MKKSHSEISLPISSTNYRKTLLDVVNYFETVFKPTPPKLTSYRRLPSVTRAVSDVYSEKDTASDSEVTIRIKKSTFVSSSCRSSPTAIHRLGSTYINTHFSFIEEYSSDSDEKMSGNTKGAKKPVVVSDDDRKKGLRQSTMAKSKNNDALSLVLSAVPDLTGGKKDTPSKLNTGAIPKGTQESILSAPQTPKGSGLQDDSIDYANSPSQQKEHLLLQSQIVANTGEGINDPELQATFDDPVYLSIPPSSYEEMERMENERKAKLSSNSDGSLHRKAVGMDTFSTPKRKKTKQQKRSQKDGDKSDSSSSTPAENMDEGSEPTTIRKPLHPASKRLADMEQKMNHHVEKISQLFEIVGNMASRLGTVAEIQESSAKALAGLGHNHTSQIGTHAAAIRSLQEETAAKFEEHGAKIEVHGASIMSIQAEAGIMKMQIHDIEQRSETCSRRMSVMCDSLDNLATAHDNMKRAIDRLGEQQQQQPNVSPTEENTNFTDNRESGIFLGGIPQIMELFRMPYDTDPFQVAGRLIQEIGCYGAISRIHVADRAVDRRERHKARAVIIYFTSIFHKRQAIIELKKFFQANTGLRVTVSDVFPPAETPRALALNRFAAEKRADKSMTRTRVVNKNGTAVLQHTQGASKEYKDSTVSEAELEPYYQPTEGGARGRQTDRNGRARDERELRDQERAARRGNNSGNQIPSSHIQGPPQQQPLPQRTGNQRRRASPPLRVSTPNSRPIGTQQLPSVSMPRGNQQQQQQQQSHPQQVLSHAQHFNVPNIQQQQPQHSGFQQSYHDNNIPAGQTQWIQGASGPAPHGFIQVPQTLLPFIQQQLYGHPQMQQQHAHQQLQYLTTENNGQQLLVRAEASNVNRDG